jgi:intracellular sulfur oxidation DsrE/DsrF family protein
MTYARKDLQRCHGRSPVKPALLLVLLAGLLFFAFLNLSPYFQEASSEQSAALPGLDAVTGNGLPRNGSVPQGMVLDVSVHSLDELRLLLDRAEELAMRPQPQGETPGVVLVLHGPEVEYFAISNYSRYRDVVDQAARLDAFDVVDVKICRSMMERLGVGVDDIPAFIEQVPYGPDEVERLVREGYVYF